MFTVGEFHASRRFPRLLRYYDEIGLLPPAISIRPPATVSTVRDNFPS